jgi:glycosyltransferase involved in cell wall biosynthesis
MPLAVRLLDLSGYELVLSNSHTVAKGVRTSSRQLHICYLETPMRFAWDLEEYYLDRFRIRGVRRAIARGVLAAMRAWDARTAADVDEYVALSEFVARRCKDFYNRSAAVIYPPVATDFFTDIGTAKESFYLTASRLTPFKRIDLIIEAFRGMPNRSLIVIGDGPERARFERRCPSNVTLLGFQSDEVLRDHMRRARAFLFAAPEDFGLVMAEAQACGTPVIALAHGGACEIVQGLDRPKATGTLFDEPTPQAMKLAINAFEERAESIRPDTCRRNAERFAPEIFRDRLTSFVSEAWVRRTSAAGLAHEG